MQRNFPLEREGARRGAEPAGQLLCGKRGPFLVTFALCEKGRRDCAALKGRTLSTDVTHVREDDWRVERRGSGRGLETGGRGRSRRARRGGRRPEREDEAGGGASGRGPQGAARRVALAVRSRAPLRALPADRPGSRTPVPLAPPHAVCGKFL